MDKIEELIQKSSEFVEAVDKAQKILGEIEKGKNEFNQNLELLHNVLSDYKENFYNQLGQIIKETKEEYLRNLAEYESILEERYKKMKQITDSFEQRQLPDYVKLICGRRVIADTDFVSVEPSNFINKYDCVNNLLITKVLHRDKISGMDVYCIYDSIIGNIVVFANVAVNSGRIMGCNFTVEDYSQCKYKIQQCVCNSEDNYLTDVICYYENEKLKNYQILTSRLAGEKLEEVCTSYEKQCFDLAKRQGLSGTVAFAEKYGK